jgi:FKBP-type peptidyl-prolyl cis-trans isomerase
VPKGRGSRSPERRRRYDYSADTDRLFSLFLKINRCTLMSRRSLITGFLLFSAGLVGFVAGSAQEPAARLPPSASGSAPAAGQAGTQLKTPDEQFAYAIGMNFGHEVLANAPEVNVDLVARGLVDVARKATPLLTPEQAQAAIDAFAAKKMGPAAEKNLKDGEAFLAENRKKPGVVTLPSGLEYSVLKAGSGRSPKATDVVRVHYNGTLLDGKTFDSTLGKEPAEFPVNRVIPGWTEALLKMKVGDKWRLYVPSRLAYGPQGTPGGPIGSCAVLVFDVELLDVVQ